MLSECMKRNALVSQGLQGSCLTTLPHTQPNPLMDLGTVITIVISFTIFIYVPNIDEYPYQIIKYSSYNFNLQ